MAGKSGKDAMRNRENEEDIKYMEQLIERIKVNRKELQQLEQTPISEEEKQFRRLKILEKMESYMVELRIYGNVNQIDCAELYDKKEFLDIIDELLQANKIRVNGVIKDFQKQTYRYRIYMKTILEQERKMKQKENEPTQEITKKIDSLTEQIEKMNQKIYLSKRYVEYSVQIRNWKQKKGRHDLQEGRNSLIEEYKKGLEQYKNSAKQIIKERIKYLKDAKVQDRTYQVELYDYENRLEKINHLSLEGEKDTKGDTR